MYVINAETGSSALASCALSASEALAMLESRIKAHFIRCTITDPSGREISEGRLRDIAFSEQH